MLQINEYTVFPKWLAQNSNRLEENFCMVSIGDFHCVKIWGMGPFTGPKYSSVECLDRLEWESFNKTNCKIIKFIKISTRLYIMIMLILSCQDANFSSNLRVCIAGCITKRCRCFCHIPWTRIVCYTTICIVTLICVPSADPRPFHVITLIRNCVT